MRYEKSLMLAKAGAIAALAALMIAGVTTLANAQFFSDTALHRLAADYQNKASLYGGGVRDEVSTNLPPSPGGGGGTPVYRKTLSVPYDVVFITFSAQADAHFGSALDMSANVTDEDGNKQLCQPLAGTGPGAPGGHDTVQGWYTLLKLPANPTVDASGPLNNCRTTTSTTPNGINNGDGGGGSADCHDNNIYFSCCARVTSDTDEFFSDDDPSQQTVEIRLADQPGSAISNDNRAFYERATIYIDAQKDPNHTLCTGANVPTGFSFGPGFGG
jgi:hypothetical protein